MLQLCQSRVTLTGIAGQSFLRATEPNSKCSYLTITKVYVVIVMSYFAESLMHSSQVISLD